MICKVLVVDDDRQILDLIKRFLSKHDMEVITTDVPARAMDLVKREKPDLLLTDVDMPRVDGRDLCLAVKKLYGSRKIPVIIMSGKKITEDDMLEGYGKGADDYMLKPLSLPVLLAKIKNLLMIYDKCSSVVRFFRKWEMKMDFEKKEIYVKGRKINLTRKEFDLLAYLAEKKGRVAGMAQLLENVWGYDPAVYNDYHTIEVHISSLRKKLGRNIAASIKKVTGYGYKLEV